ncbi:FAD synthetase [Streptomyces chartreusis]|uniref:FAD synthetase n=1 Tax=Streptomyces chartreusis TaxID=1969 RepID=UPI00363C82AE
MTYLEPQRGMVPFRELAVVGIDDTERRMRSIAIGSFDGVHLGHRDVVRGCDTVLTFAPHPLRVLRPESAPALLTSHNQKIAKLAALGVREVVTIPFDTHWAKQSAADFVDKILVGILNAREISVGFNFRYGAHGYGTPEKLQQDRRFRTRVVSPVTVGSTVVSSTAIRMLVQQGDVRGATRLLGAPFAQPATIRDDHTVIFPIDLAVPSAKTYICDIGGVVARLSFDGEPHLVDTADPVGPNEQETMVTFLSESTSAVAQWAYAAGGAAAPLLR